MKIAFFGHRNDYKLKEKVGDELKRIFDEKIATGEVELFFGGKSDFDYFAKETARNYKQKNPKLKLTFVYAYMPKEDLYVSGIDETVYPPIENTPLKFAIIARNKWIVEQSDLIIFCVNREYGGAYEMLKHAKKKNKEYINLGTVKA